jgi:hypothetical protein
VAAGGLRMGNPRRPLRHYAAGDPDGTRTDGPQAAQPHLTAHTLRLISDTLCKIETLAPHSPYACCISETKSQNGMRLISSSLQTAPYSADRLVENPRTRVP